VQQLQSNSEHLGKWVIVIKFVFQHVIAILLVLWTISVMRRQGSANAEQIPMVENVISVSLVSGTSPIVSAVSATDMQMDATLELVPVPIVEIGHLVTTVIGDYLHNFHLNSVKQRKTHSLKTE
jgi:protein-S-isoprenylcysteine O-methyltransferase Ste14